VVDDDSDTLTLIGLTLQRRGFEVIKAQSGQQAINLLAHDRPDLVILDVMMPQMDGYEVCREIKADPRTADLPVIMLTAKAQTQSQLEGFRVGAIDYITKPVHPQDLVTRIQTVLERAQSAHQAGGAQVIAVSGARGGVGASTLAVNLAAALAAQHRTVLVDLELSGTAAIQLGLVPVRSLADLMSYDADPIDRGHVEAAITPHASGLHLLAAAMDEIIIPDDISAERTEKLLSVLNTAYDEIIIDLPHRIDPAMATILGHSDVIALVTQQTVAHLHDTKRLLYLLRDRLGISMDRILLLLNRYDAKAEVKQEDFTEVFPGVPLQTIPSDYVRASESINLGIPICESAASSPLGKSLLKLAADLSQGKALSPLTPSPRPGEPAPAAPPPKKAGLFGWLKR